MLSFNAMTNKEIVERLEQILKDHNPCGFHKIKVRVQVKEEIFDREDARCHGGAPCCGGCRHLTKQGCGLKAAISCKFFFCHAAWDKMPKPLKDEVNALGEAYTGKLYFRDSAYSRSANSEHNKRYPGTDHRMMTTKPPFVWG